MFGKMYVAQVTVYSLSNYYYPVLLIINNVLLVQMPAPCFALLSCDILLFLDS